MADRQLEQMFWDAGYRMLQGQRKEIKVYYKYYREGFYTVITVDQTHGYAMTAQEKYQTEQWVMNQFYHPTQVLGDFPEGISRISGRGSDSFARRGSGADTRSLFCLPECMGVFSAEWAGDDL